MIIDPCLSFKKMNEAKEAFIIKPSHNLSYMIIDSDMMRGVKCCNLIGSYVLHVESLSVGVV